MSQYSGDGALRWCSGRATETEFVTIMCERIFVKNILVVSACCLPNKQRLFFLTDS